MARTVIDTHEDAERYAAMGWVDRHGV